MSIFHVEIESLFLLLMYISIVSVDGCNNVYGKHLDYKKHKNYPLLYSEEGCGESITNRIIGGHDAILGQYPWLVLIDYILGTCGGTLINTLYVVTAAHCEPHIKTWGLLPTKFLIGEHNKETQQDCQGDRCAPPLQVGYAESVLAHPGWQGDRNEGLGPYDIALVRLKKKVTFNDYVKPICLPFEPQDHIDLINKSAEVAGWGVQYRRPTKYATVLQTLTLKMFPQSVCEAEFHRLLDRHFTMAGISDAEPTVVCGGGVVGEDSCIGDSGGPLMMARVVDGVAAYVLVGVVSFGMAKCATTDTPGFYTDVRLFLDWILDSIKA